MALRVNNNISALNAKRHLTVNNRELTTRLERLSSGLRVIRAADDAAGLSIREDMRAEVSGLKMSVRNAEQATNLIQVAEGSLNEVNAILVRMRELAVQSASSTVTDENRESIQAEFGQLTEEITRIAKSTTYNGQSLLTGYGNAVDLANSDAIADSSDTGVTGIRISSAAAGTYTFEDAADDGELTLGNGTVSQTIRIGNLLDNHAGGSAGVGQVSTGTQVVANFDRLGIQVTMAGPNVIDETSFYSDDDLEGKEIVITAGEGGSFQVGAFSESHNQLEISVDDMQASGVSINMSGKSVATITDARTSITAIDQAVSAVAMQRGSLGAFQNRLEFTIAYTENEIENVQASEAAISDADIANEVTHFTRAQILSQAATAMLAQARLLPQNALALLQ
ncbi:MAG: flagellin [Planctomycetaceae bacterium]|nr:flagellin [Planctomycetaceae bacterium]